VFSSRISFCFCRHFTVLIYKDTLSTTGNYVQDGELVADEIAAALTACRTLAKVITEFRFPAPRIFAFMFFVSHYSLHFISMNPCPSIFLFMAKLMNLQVWVNDRKRALKQDILFLGRFLRTRIHLMNR
jgi:hypothetical protein